MVVVVVMVVVVMCEYVCVLEVCPSVKVMQRPERHLWCLPCCSLPCNKPLTLPLC